MMKKFLEQSFMVALDTDKGGIIYFMDLDQTTILFYIDFVDNDIFVNQQQVLDKISISDIKEFLIDYDVNIFPFDEVVVPEILNYTTIKNDVSEFHNHLIKKPFSIASYRKYGKRYFKIYTNGSEFIYTSPLYYTNIIRVSTYLFTYLSDFIKTNNLCKEILCLFYRFSDRENIEY